MQVFSCNNYNVLSSYDLCTLLPLLLYFIRRLLKVSFLFVCLFFQDVGSRQFISVLDIEERRHRQDLPFIHPSSTTSAQLHVLATSVIRGDDVGAIPQPSVTIPENLLKPTTQPGLYKFYRVPSTENCRAAVKAHHCYSFKYLCIF